MCKIGGHHAMIGNDQILKSSCRILRIIMQQYYTKATGILRILIKKRMDFIYVSNAAVWQHYIVDAKYKSNLQ